MSQFSIDAVETLDYDFTSFPQNKDSKKKCTGKGTIPEPTQKHLDGYALGLKQAYAVETDEEVSDAVAAEKSSAASQEVAEKRMDKVASLTAALCQNSPNKAEILQLPPRIRTAFLKWVYQELADPKVTRGASQD